MEDFDDIPGHGGRRAGAGRPKGSRTDSAVASKYRAARAQNEAAKADLAQLKLRELRSAYVDRAAVIQAAAVAHDLLSHALQPLASTLAEQGIPPWACTMVRQAVEVELSSVSAAFADVAGPEPIALEQ